MADAFVRMQSRMSWWARSSGMPGMQIVHLSRQTSISILSEGTDCIGESHQCGLYAALRYASSAYAAPRVAWCLPSTRPQIGCTVRQKRVISRGSP